MGFLGNAKAGDCKGHSSCWVKVASWEWHQVFVLIDEPNLNMRKPGWVQLSLIWRELPWFDLIWISRFSLGVQAWVEFDVLVAWKLVPSLAWVQVNCWSMLWLEYVQHSSWSSASESWCQSWCDNSMNNCDLGGGFLEWPKLHPSKAFPQQWTWTCHLHGLKPACVDGHSPCHIHIHTTCTLVCRWRSSFPQLWKRPEKSCR